MLLKPALLKWGSEELAKLGPEEAKASSERLLEATLGCDRSSLYLNREENVTKAQAGKFRRLISKRKIRVPVAYLLQKAPFWEEVLEVRPGCLIPRPETEILVESFINHSGFKKESSFSFLDLCAGTGAIGIALLRHFPNARGMFADFSKTALTVTRRNLKKYGLNDRAEALHSDLLKRFSSRTKKWDAIVCNPPYVAKKDLAGLEPELKFEPRLALDGGKDGLRFYREIIRQVPDFLTPDGWLVLEMGAGQAKAISGLMKQAFQHEKIFKDYLGIDRVMMARVQSQNG